MKKILLFLFSCTFAMASCQQALEESTFSNEVRTSESPSLESFSLLLSKAVSNIPELRGLIKEEALKQIDHDYDVFYPIIKDKIVTDNKTVRDILKQYDNNKILDEIEQIYPLLTILVPKLPSGFNAESWDCQNDIPFITARLGKSQNTFYKDGELEFEIEANAIPGFPVLVVKNNERIVKNSSSSRNAGMPLLNSEYAFLDEAFDNVTPHVKTRNRIALEDIEYLKTAYNEMGVSPNYWQRDNIYYGLTKTNTQGPFKRNYVESIRVIEFSEQAFSVMTDQPEYDPKLNTEDHFCLNRQHLINFNSLWQDGNFEFKIDITINNQNGLGANISKMLTVSPGELYSIDYIEKRDALGHFFHINGIVSRPYHPNINLIPWDLKNNSFSWKFNIYEIDKQATYTVQEKCSSEFATNFGFSIGSGDETKIGLNFGASAKVTKESTFTRVIYEESDDLGTLEAHFSDPVMLFEYEPKLIEGYTISNPMVEMVLCPVKLY